MTMKAHGMVCDFCHIYRSIMLHRGGVSWQRTSTRSSDARKEKHEQEIDQFDCKPRGRECLTASA